MGGALTAPPFSFLLLKMVCAVIMNKHNCFPLGLSARVSTFSQCLLLDLSTADASCCDKSGLPMGHGIRKYLVILGAEACVAVPG